MRTIGRIGLMMALACSTCCEAATVVYSSLRFTGSSNNREITYRLVSQGVMNGSNAVFGTPLVVQPVHGGATNNLLAANYTLEIDGVSTLYPFGVPDGEGTYNVWDLVNQGIYVLARTNSNALTNNDTRNVTLTGQFTGLDNGLTNAAGQRALHSGEAENGSGLTNISALNLQPFTANTTNMDNATWLGWLSANFSAYSNMNRYGTPNTYAAIKNQSPFTVLFQGNGWVNEASGAQFDFELYTLTNLFGTRGFIGNPYALAGTGQAYCPLTVIGVTQTPLGAYIDGRNSTWWPGYLKITNNASGFLYLVKADMSPFSHDTYEIDYVAGPTGGPFTVSTNNNLGWTVMTTLNGFSATPQGKVFRWTNSATRLANNYQIALTNTATCTNNFVAFGVFNSTVKGVTYVQQGVQATAPSELEAVPASVRAPIYASWNPTLVLDLWSTTPGDVTQAAAYVAGRDFYRTNLPNADVVMCSQFQVGPSATDDITLKYACARTNGFVFFDGFDVGGGFGSSPALLARGINFDGGHLSSAGYNFYGQLLWNFLGLPNAMGGGVASGTLSGNGAGLTNIPQAAITPDLGGSFEHTFSVAAPLAMNTSTWTLTYNGWVSGTPGNAAGLTNMGAASLTGTITNPIVSPSITGNGAGLTNLVSYATNVFNVRAYGAYGDNSHIDSVAITNAFKDWVAYGGVLYFPSGTYLDTNQHYLANNKGSIIAGDGAASIWMSHNPSNTIFLESPADMRDIVLKADSTNGFNIGFMNTNTPANMHLDNVAFKSWGCGWLTACAGVTGNGVTAEGCKVGIRMLGFSDGGTINGRLGTCLVGVEVGGPYITGNKGTHGNKLYFEGSGNKYPYVIAETGNCVVGGYFEGDANGQTSGVGASYYITNYVALGYPPDTVALFPGVIDTNTTTYGVTIDGLGGQNNAGPRPISIVGIYTTNCNGVHIRNTSADAGAGVQSYTSGADVTPVILENAYCATYVMVFSDGANIPTFGQTARGTFYGQQLFTTMTCEVNTMRRSYWYTNLVTDLSRPPLALVPSASGVSDPAYAAAPDAEATAYCTRAGISDALSQGAIHKLVKDLKSANLWTNQWYALYPFAGTNAQAATNNLASASAFNLVPHGTLYYTNGLTGDGSTGYADTQFYIDSSGAAGSSSNLSLFAYVVAKNSSGGANNYVMGINDAMYCALLLFADGPAGSVNASIWNPDGAVAIIPVTDVRGPWLCSRTRTDTCDFYSGFYNYPLRNAAPYTAPEHLPIFLCAGNAAGLYHPSTFTLGIAGVAKGFSLQQWNALRPIIDNYCAVMGRKVP